MYYIYIILTGYMCIYLLEYTYSIYIYIKCLKLFPLPSHIESCCSWTTASPDAAPSQCHFARSSA